MAGAAQNIWTVSLIAAGGAAGTVLRFAVGGAVLTLTGWTFPLGTMLINVTGCLAIGFLGTALTDASSLRPEWRLAILIGVLGGYTTFSTFGWETFKLIQAQQHFLATMNVLGSVLAGLLGVWAGVRLAQTMYGA